MMCWHEQNLLYQRLNSYLDYSCKNIFKKRKWQIFAYILFFFVEANHVVNIENINS